MTCLKDAIHTNSLSDYRNTRFYTDMIPEVLSVSVLMICLKDAIHIPIVLVILGIITNTRCYTDTDTNSFSDTRNNYQYQMLY